MYLTMYEKIMKDSLSTQAAYIEPLLLVFLDVQIFFSITKGHCQMPDRIVTSRLVPPFLSITLHICTKDSIFARSQNTTTTIFKKKNLSKCLCVFLVLHFEQDIFSPFNFITVCVPVYISHNCGAVFWV